MSNSTGFIITGLVLGVAALAAGGLFFSNKSKPVPIDMSKFGVYNYDEDGEKFYSGGKKTKNRHHRRRHKSIKHHK